jgi:hypothetical protein
MEEASSHLAAVARLRVEAHGLTDVPSIAFANTEEEAPVHVAAVARLREETLGLDGVSSLIFPEAKVATSSHLAAVARLREETIGLGESAGVELYEPPEPPARGHLAQAAGRHVEGLRVGNQKPRCAEDDEKAQEYSKPPP